MSPESATRARNHYRTQKTLNIAAVLAARRAAKAALPRRDAQRVTDVIAAYQLLAALLAMKAMAEESGLPPRVIAAAFSGTTSLGYPLVGPVAAVLDSIAFGMEHSQSFDDLVWKLDQLVTNEVAQAGRESAGVEIFMQPMWDNYVRLLYPPSCPRCVILAGRIYRDNEGFERHPNCDCVHWPVEDWDAARDLGLVFSPGEAFDLGIIGSYRKDGTWKPGLSKADTQAIEDGADITQVINAHRGMQSGNVWHGMGTVKFTTEGLTRWRKDNPGAPYRLRPETIYALAAGDRDEAIRLLRFFGYIT